MKYIFVVFVTLVATICHAQEHARNVVRMNDGWEFTKEAVDPAGKQSIAWEPVTLPHTWNVADIMDDTPGYYRGACWYRKRFDTKVDTRTKEVFLYFEGANQETDVFINGKKAGTHTGGYTGFSIPVTKLLNTNAGTSNELLVRVDNSFNRNIPPLSADFTFYGGIYRDMYLITLDRIHFSGKEYDNKGVYIKTPTVSAEKAFVSVSGNIVNEYAATRRVRVMTAIRDGNGKNISTVSSLQTLKPHDTLSFVQDIPRIARPHLWSPGDPYLYIATTQIIDLSSGRVLDEEMNPVGFRWFSFSPVDGFFLNGRACKLVGASRHQDYQGLGNAVPNELAVKDIELLKQMGANFLRVAHYPQDPAVLEACDRLGILASVEIPIVNEITESDSFNTNCRRMLLEMIRQNYNHPSIIIWCYMNEIFLRPQFANDKPRQQLYFSHVAGLAKMLDSTARKEDPARYTMIANHGDFNRYRDNGITAIPMLVGWNLYSGWYGGVLTDFATFLDRHRREIPDKPMLVTEYGADADPRIRSLHPVRFDKSVEYTTRFHQYYLDEMLKRPFVAGAVIWNLADFNSEGREETMPHINNKGLLMWDRTPKDPYYYYQAKLLSRPFVKITSGYWKARTGVADSNALTCHQLVQVAANMDSVGLRVNGEILGRKKVVNGLAEWQVGFVNGINWVTADGVKGGVSVADSASISFHLLPRQLKDDRIPFTQLNVLLGADRYYIDTAGEQTWIPGQAYETGSWGFIGGHPFTIKGNSRLPYGTDKNIKGTWDDPVYQTQQVGIEQFRLDVPDGRYEMVLHFAELEGGVVKSLAYNLSDAGRKEEVKERIFQVFVNDSLFLDNFNIGSDYGVAIAVAKNITLRIIDGKGIRIVFKSISGKAVLNALQVKKLE